MIENSAAEIAVHAVIEADSPRARSLLSCETIPKPAIKMMPRASRTTSARFMVLSDADKLDEAVPGTFQEILIFGATSD